MKYLKAFESWNLFKNSNFKITYIPVPGEKQKSDVFEDTSRKKVIKDTVNLYPQCKIIKIEKLNSDGEVDDMEYDELIDQLDEGIVNYESDNIKSFYDDVISEFGKSQFLTLDKIKEFGDNHDIEVVNYDTFYKELSDEMKKTAPPRQAPCFALVNPTTRKARVVINVSRVGRDMFEHIYHMLKHENVHIGQHSRSGGKGAGEGMDVTNRKKYFSNKDEVMAFSQSIVDMLMTGRGQSKPISKQAALDKLKLNPLWNDIKKSVDIDILQRYKKYIYLYLDKEFGKDLKKIQRKLKLKKEKK